MQTPTLKFPFCPKENHEGVPHYSAALNVMWRTCAVNKTHRLFGRNSFFFFAKHILVKPLPIVPYSCQSFLRFVNAMAKPFVNDEARRHLSVLQTTVQFVCIGNGNPFVEFAVLY